MDRSWLEKAHKYISEHNAYTDVSDIVFDDVGSVAMISATVSVNLPSKFIEAGITDSGVKNQEKIQIHFYRSFPLQAPIIQLRDDFPRSFPHIYPSEKSVFPCIYEESLSELLQQDGWMNEILNQLVVWLEKAASNELMNYDQGWEPMRCDRIQGYIWYEIDEILSEIKRNGRLAHHRVTYYKSRYGLILVDRFFALAGDAKRAQHVFILGPRVINAYIPNSITTLKNLYDYANYIGLNSIKDIIEEIDLDNIDDDVVFVTLAIKRPVNIIGSDSDIEFLNFVIEKSKHRKAKHKKKKRTLPECKVHTLSHVSHRSPALLKRISGTKTVEGETKSIALLGCGSLGSKIGIHLVRNGNGPFLCIDNDMFMSHNNVRHALTYTYTENKAVLMALFMYGINGIPHKAIEESAFQVNYSNTKIIIDSTASFSVRNFLMATFDLPPIISCYLYNKGRHGLLLIENKKKTSNLAVIWAYLYYQSLDNLEIRQTLIRENLENVRIGQSCSSQTLIVDDSRISLIAAIMSLRIQTILESGLPDNSEILFTAYDDKYSLSSKNYLVPEAIKIQSSKEKGWTVYILIPVVEDMRRMMFEKEPKETGGVLLGSFFMYPKTIVITGIVKAPSDSIEKPTSFVLGTEGLEREIKNVEEKTNGKVTYLGTWHSHPYGEEASSTDRNTLKKLQFVRNCEPTVCLIITHDGILIV